MAVRHKPQPDRQTIFLPKQGMPNSGIAMTHPASFSKNKSPSSALSHKLQSQVYFYWVWVTISRLCSFMYWVHKSMDYESQWSYKIKKKLGQYGRQNMLRPNLKIWEWEWIFGRTVKAISSLCVRSLCIRVLVILQMSAQSRNNN